MLPFLPQWHYLHIHDEVLPYAREHGVTEEQIATMLTANPRHLSSRHDERGPQVPDRHDSRGGFGREVVAAGRGARCARGRSGGAFKFDWQEFGWGSDYYARPAG